MLPSEHSFSYLVDPRKISIVPEAIKLLNYGWHCIPESYITPAIIDKQGFSWSDLVDRMLSSFHLPLYTLHLPLYTCYVIYSNRFIFIAKFDKEFSY